MKLKTQIKAGLGGGWLSNNHNQPTALKVRTTLRGGIRQTGMSDLNHNQPNPRPTGI